LLILSYLGMLFVSRIPNLELPLLLSRGVAEPIALMTFGIAFVFAFALGLHTPGFVWRALVAALVTGGCYWFVMWFLLGHSAMIWNPDPTPPFAHRLPDLGNGMGPMMKTVLISNLIAGAIGGWATLFLLEARHPFSSGVLFRRLFVWNRHSELFISNDCHL
jgi:hypothetical protein